MKSSWLLLSVILTLLNFGHDALATEPASPTRQVLDAPGYVATQHTIEIPRGRINYTAKVGTIPLLDEDGNVEARMFYVSYELKAKSGSRERPLTFMFNGGPGSSSLWLHMGSFGPFRLDISAPDALNRKPQFGPNPYTLLEQTDLVFLDAIGTGYSHALKPHKDQDFWGNDQDSAAFAQAIHTYLTMSGKWMAPKYLFGESYGTMRAAFLTNRLESEGISLTGIVFMSTILNFAHFAPDLDQSAIDLLPTYATTASYYGTTSQNPSDAGEVARLARSFASGPYASTLAKGDLATDEEKHEIASRMHAMIGLSTDYIERANLRIGINQFRRELLRKSGRSIGELDTRYSGNEVDRVGENATYDPAEATVSSAYIAAFNNYIVSELDYRQSMPYVAANSDSIMRKWDWAHQPPSGPRQGSLADSLQDLSAAMHHNPKIRILALNGFYDLMTPFFATEFDLARLSLGKENKKRIHLKYYPSGHMLYTDDSIMEKLYSDISNFYRY